MSVRALIADIMTAANDPSARDRQYRDSVFDLTFNKITTIDECFASIEDAILNSKGRKGAPLTGDERRILMEAVTTAFNNVYTPRNIKNAHKKQGYKIFANPVKHKGEEALAKYTNFTRRGTSGGKKLAVYLRQGMMNLDPLGPVVTYSGSMQTAKGGENRKVINMLWFTMVREALKLSRAGAGKKKPKTGQKGYAAKRIGSSRTGSRALRLHGPTASQNAYGSTGETSDTSVPVVALVEALQDIKHNNFKLPKGVTSTDIYQKAFRDIIHELDNEFKITSETISSIVNADKVIRIQLHQGGDQHQHYMTHADTKSVNRIIEQIRDKLLSTENGPLDPEYEASKSIAEMAKDAVVAQVVTSFFTKSGKPDMRFKVNRKVSANRGKRQKTTEHGSFRQKEKAKSKSRGVKAAKKRSKTSRRSESSGMMGMGVAGATTSPIALKELIQAQLAERLLDNMGTPALVNRTGRLRRSAQVQNVMVGPRGGTEVQYTYMKDPYATFEPGGNMGSRDRDPRKLIGGTIREIATELTGNKFIRTRSL